MSEIGQVSTRSYPKTERDLANSNAKTVRHFLVLRIDSMHCPMSISVQTKYQSENGASSLSCKGCGVLGHREFIQSLRPMSEIGRVSTRSYPKKTERDLANSNAKTVRHFMVLGIDSMHCPKSVSVQTKYQSENGASPLSHKG